MATIKQIDGRTVHQIQSGQVIIDLCSVVKELVENSVDAGATNIDVRFKNQGLDLIEVQDNGNGIPPASYASVALKHHTSKLTSYADIGSLGTFGFRGEALASLCALSTMTVTTCLAEGAPKGSKLTFEASGKLKDTTVVAAQKGTTVSVEKLFHNLPVRRRELERNIKREWHKVISLLNQYACIQTNTKFVVSQQPTKGKRIILFSTKGNPTTRDNIINIFGAKTMSALVPLDLAMEMEPSTLSSALQSTVDPTTISKEVRIVGHVSRPAHGDGRQTPDRQMFFINGRPCGLPQFAKTFNEVYKSYNSTQSPFIFADIQLDTHMYDVNVSPDKRTILLHDQNHLLENIRTSLVDIFDSHDYSLSTPQLARSKQAPSSEVRPSSFTLGTPDTSDRVRTIRTSPPGTSPIGTPSSDTRSAAGRSAHLPSSRGRPSRAESSDKTSNLLNRWLDRKETEEQSGGDSVSESDAPVVEEPSQTAPEEPASETSEHGPSTPSLASDAPETAAGAHPVEPEDESEESDAHDAASDAEPSSGARGVLSTARQSKPATDPVPSSPIPAVRLMTRSAGDGLPKMHRSSAIRPPEPAKVIIGRARPQIKSYGQPIASHEVDIEDDEAEDEDEAQEDDEDAVEEEDDIDESEEEEAGGMDVDEDQSETENPTFGSSLSQKFASGSTTTRQTGLRPGSRATKPVSDGSREEESPVPSEEAHSEYDEPSESQPGADDERDEATREEEEVEGESCAENTTAKGGTQVEASTDARMKSLEKGSRSKYSTLHISQNLSVDEARIQAELDSWTGITPHGTGVSTNKADQVEDITAADAESKLSLIISKSDFAKMRVAGQFNLGFIIAVSPKDSDDTPDNKAGKHDELFIIDQHASDEKYNFERLQDSTVVQSQRLVHAKRLELTALEEEIVMQSTEAIEANGFKVDVDMDGEYPVGSRCLLTALPLSRETTFNIADLEELIALLADESAESKHIPRPSKVRKMFAMRACRSSIMIGKPLTRNQMYGLVSHMGELDKPWNCPHGRPTMRHLCRMQMWDEKGWVADGDSVPLSSWAAY